MYIYLVISPSRYFRRKFIVNILLDGSKSNSNGNVTFKVVLVEDLLDYGST